MVAAPAHVAQAPAPLLRGEVLRVEAGSRRVLIRHAPFAGMPAMTMEFRPANGSPPLHAGDAVRARLDERSDPWTLRDVTVAATPGTPARYIPVLSEGDTIPALPLRDQRGRRTVLTGDGRTTIVSFIYTRCRDARMCPLVSAKFAAMQRAIRGERIRLVTLTLDPAYDTPAVLARYGAAFDADPARWTLATGDPATVDELATRLGIARSVPQPGVVVHSEAVVVVDLQGRIARIAGGNDWLPADVLATARGVETQTSSPLAAARLWLAQTAARCGSAVPAVGGTAVFAILGAFVLLYGALFARATGGSASKAGRANK